MCIQTSFPTTRLKSRREGHSKSKECQLIIWIVVDGPVGHNTTDHPGYHYNDNPQHDAENDKHPCPALINLGLCEIANPVFILGPVSIVDSGNSRRPETAKAHPDSGAGVIPSGDSDYYWRRGHLCDIHLSC